MPRWGCRGEGRSVPWPLATCPLAVLTLKTRIRPISLPTRQGNWPFPVKTLPCRSPKPRYTPSACRHGTCIYLLVFNFYQDWKRHNPDQKKYNICLKEDINIRSVSIDETAAQASISYLSTLAVLQLDAVLTNAWLLKSVPSKADSKNQRRFESMLIMEYVCQGVGRVKMTVGVKRSDKSKVQYCITAIDTDKIKQEAE